MNIQRSALLTRMHTLFRAGTAYTQWVQTNGISGGFIRCFALRPDDHGRLDGLLERAVAGAGYEFKNAPQ